MNITIIGAGAIGTMLATRLSNNNKIKLIIKPEHTNLKERKAIILREISGEERNINIDFEDKIKETDLIIIAVILSFLFSYVTVKFFLDYLNKFSLNIFVTYRIIISLILFAIIYF